MSAIGSHNYPGRTAGDAALLDLTTITKLAVANDATVYGMAQAFANGLTGDSYGYRSRALAKAIVAAFAENAVTSLEDLKAAEQQARR